MTTITQKRQPTQAAQCAKLTRLILKTNFPETKFTVRCENYAGGNSVTVSYVDGPCSKKVEELTEYRLQYGHFDGMTDCYEYSNGNEELPQVKFFFVNREISEGQKEKARQEIMKNYGMTEWNDQVCMNKMHRWADQVLWGYFKEKDL